MSLSMPAQFMTKNPKSFGQILRTSRLAKGHTLRGFAGILGVSPTYLSLVETDQADYPPPEERVRKMATLLGADGDHWVTLAGRVPEDVEDIILNQPESMPALLRAAKGLSAEKLRALAEIARKQQKGSS